MGSLFSVAIAIAAACRSGARSAQLRLLAIGSYSRDHLSITRLLPAPRQTNS